MSAPAALSGLRHVVAERSGKRAGRRRLARELAQFRTPAEQLELRTMIERQAWIEYEVARFRAELAEAGA